MLLMIICIVLSVILKEFRFNKVTHNNTYMKNQQVEILTSKDNNPKRFEIERKIISLAKSRVSDARDEIVKLMVELYKLGDTSTFLEKNPFVHDAIFNMTD